MPEQILARLRVLDLSDNNLQDFPESFICLEDSEILDLSLNDELLLHDAYRAEEVLVYCTRLKRLGWRHDGSLEMVSAVTMASFLSLHSALVMSDGTMAKVLFEEVARTIPGRG